MQIPEQYLKSGRVTHDVRTIVQEIVKPGVRYVDACEAIEKEIVSRGGQPAFPTGIGVNDVTAHYAPQDDDQSVFGDEDLVKVDFGVHVDGYVTDTAVSLTFNPKHELMLQATEKALNAAISVVGRDPRTGEVGREVYREASRFGFRTIENLTGHTVDRYVVHAGKSIPNIYVPNLPALSKGEVFAIEPFLTLGSAAGYVVDSQRETIFSIANRKRMGDRGLDSFAEMIWAARKGLPFTPRWYAKDFGRDKVKVLVKDLLKKKVARSYPTLVEASGSPVAQFEHTMALQDGGLLLLT